MTENLTQSIITKIGPQGVYFIGGIVIGWMLHGIIYNPADRQQLESIVRDQLTPKACVESLCTDVASCKCGPGTRIEQRGPLVVCSCTQAHSSPIGNP